MYILICGYPPFGGDDDAEILVNVRKGVFDFDEEEWDDISKEVKDLIKKLICKPEKRLSAQEALGHIWFKNMLEGKSPVMQKLSGKKFETLKNFQKNSKMK